MELKDFIKNTLVEIATGVKEAQEATKELGATVNPEVIDSKSGNKSVSKENVGSVEFNVAVTATDEANAGASIKVAIFNAGGGLKEINTSVSTISFKVPIVLPLCHTLN